MWRRAGLGQAARALQWGMIVLAAWGAATLAGRLLHLDLSPRIDAPPAPSEGEAAAERRRRPADQAAILRRNLFGATDLEVATEDSPRRGASNLRLRGIASSHGASFAVFEDEDSGEQDVFAVGDRIFDGPRLVGVDATGADVLVRGRKRRYEIEDRDALEAGASQGAAAPAGDGAKAHHGAKAEGRAHRHEARAGKHRRAEKPGKPGKGAKGAKDAKPAKAARKESSVGSGIRKTAEGAWTVDRREVETAVGNLNEVITQVRAVPVLEDGKSSGFKLFNIRSGSIFEKMGLEDGDVVQRVNDTELSDPSKAVGLLEEIQSMKQIRVHILRSGKPRSYTYTIR